MVMVVETCYENCMACMCREKERMMGEGDGRGRQREGEEEEDGKSWNTTWHEIGDRRRDLVNHTGALHRTLTKIMWFCLPSSCLQTVIYCHPGCAGPMGEKGKMGPPGRSGAKGEKGKWAPKVECVPYGHRWRTRQGYLLEGQPGMSFKFILHLCYFPWGLHASGCSGVNKSPQLKFFCQARASYTLSLMTHLHLRSFVQLGLYGYI